MSLCAQVVESLEDLWHKCRRQVVSEIVETHPHQFMLGKPLWAFEGETSPSSNEIGDVFTFPLFGLNQLRDPNSSLRVAELTKEFLFHSLPPDDGGLREIRIPRKGCSFQ